MTVDDTGSGVGVGVIMVTAKFMAGGGVGVVDARKDRGNPTLHANEKNTKNTRGNRRFTDFIV